MNEQSTQEPLALFHAKWLKKSLTIGAWEAGAELERLHEEVGRLNQALKQASDQTEPVHADESMWCRYIAGMIGQYIGEPLGSEKEKAIAGIIERRLWNLPKPAPAVAQSEPDGWHFKFNSGAESFVTNVDAADLIRMGLQAGETCTEYLKKDSASEVGISKTETTTKAPAVAQGEPRFPFAGFDPNFCPGSNPENPQEAPAVAQEPVHFRAVLCREQQDQALGVVPKIVGFVDKKAAEQFILEQRDFKGWKYNLEPLYTEAPAVAHPPAEVVRELVEALQEFVNAWSDCLGCPQTDSERFQLSEARDKAESALKSAKEHGL